MMENQTYRNILLKVLLGVWMATICLVPKHSIATPIMDLFSGGTYSFDNLILSDWDLVHATSNVGLKNLVIGPGSGNPGEVGLELTNRALYAKNGTLKFAYDFLVTGIGTEITAVRGDLGSRSIRGYTWDTPWITGTTKLGTNKGGKDLGQTTDIYSFNQNTNPGWIDIPIGLKQVWVRNVLTLYEPYNGGFASLGEYGGYGTAFRNIFATQQSQFQSPVPEPNTAILYGIGLLLFSVKMRKRFSY